MRDNYGKYQILSGFEAPGQCFWCGAKIPIVQRYCSGGEHQKIYWDYFYLPYASKHCKERYGYKCAECESGNKLEAHHIEPINGDRNRSWNKKNRPENLIALCHDCHKDKHRV